MATASWETQMCAVPSHGMFPIGMTFLWTSLLINACLNINNLMAINDLM